MDKFGEDGGSEALPPLFNGNLESDTAEYMIFVFNGNQDGAVTTASKPRAKLEQLRKTALQLSGPLIKDYIWQRDGFDLQVVSRNGTLHTLAFLSSSLSLSLFFPLIFFLYGAHVWTDNFSPGLLYLDGRTSYGDCVEDEWFIVYMLRELTRSFAGAWARICDTDGEFLLIEGAKTVPSWLNPEIDANRVWIHDGMLKIIPLGITQAPGKGSTTSSDPQPLSLEEAVSIIKSTPEALIHSQALDDEVFYRLRKYPGHLATSLHYARLVIPRKSAYILHDRPRAVAPAVDAFISRDPLTAKRILDLAGLDALLQFSPTDLVPVSVRFTRVMYAQMRGQRFTPPKGWPVLFASAVKDSFSPKKSTAVSEDDVSWREKLEVATELSMKLTFGFEIMASTAEKSNSRIVREVGLVLDDLAEDGEDPAALPSDEEIRNWKDVDRESDDTWLNINFDDFERELDGRGQDRQVPAPTSRNTADRGPKDGDLFSGFGDAGLQTDLRRIVSKFNSFLNDNDAGIEGTNLDGMDIDDDDDNDNDADESSEDEDDGVAFNEEEFSRLMKEMMGLPPSNTATTKATPVEGDTNNIRVGDQDAMAVASRTLPTDGGNDMDGDEEDILKLAAQFEAELKGHGALRLNPPKDKNSTGLPATGGLAEGSESKHRALHVDSESDEEGDVDVDFNLAKNLLESFRGQEGMSGPAGNILSMLGLALPRDNEDDSHGK